MFRHSVAHRIPVKAPHPAGDRSRCRSGLNMRRRAIAWRRRRPSAMPFASAIHTSASTMPARQGPAQSGTRLPRRDHAVHAVIRDRPTPCRERIRSPCQKLRLMPISSLIAGHDFTVRPDLDEAIPRLVPNLGCLETRTFFTWRFCRPAGKDCEVCCTARAGDWPAAIGPRVKWTNAANAGSAPFETTFQGAMCRV